MAVRIRLHHACPQRLSPTRHRTTRSPAAGDLAPHVLRDGSLQPRCAKFESLTVVVQPIDGLPGPAVRRRGCYESSTRNSGRATALGVGRSSMRQTEAMVISRSFHRVTSKRRQWGRTRLTGGASWSDQRRVSARAPEQGAHEHCKSLLRNHSTESCWVLCKSA